MKNNKKLSIIVLVLITTFLCGCISSQVAKEVTDGIYVLYRDNGGRIRYYTKELEEVNDFEAPEGWDLCSAKNGKVCMSNAGNSRKVGNSVAVLKDGIIITNIKLKYSMPLNIKYNPYNELVYVSHKYKITYNEENCFSVIDTELDKEIEPIMYDEYVLDFSFSEDNYMFVSSQDVSDYQTQIDIIDLSDSSLEKRIVIDPPLDSIIYSEVTNLVYGVCQRSRERGLFVIDWINESWEEIPLDFIDASQLEIGRKDNTKLYILNSYRDDNNEGRLIAEFDLLTGKVEKKYDNLENVEDFVVNDNIIALGKTLDVIYKMDPETNEMTKRDIPYPCSIVQENDTE